MISEISIQEYTDEVLIRKLLLLKLIMSISSQIGDSMEGETALKPDVTQMLTFIKMSLDYDRAAVDGKLDGLALNKLRIVQDDEKDDEGDSDDEDLAPGLEGVDKSEHMSVTAVNLLLALLESKSKYHCQLLTTILNASYRTP